MKWLHMHTKHTHIFLKEVGGGRRGKNSTWVWKKTEKKKQRKKTDGEVQEIYASLNKKNQNKTKKWDRTKQIIEFEEKEV